MFPKELKEFFDFLLVPWFHLFSLYTILRTVVATVDISKYYTFCPESPFARITCKANKLLKTVPTNLI